MTGFGASSRHLNGAHYHLELRSLNNRYFKASIRLPDDLQGLEAELEAALRSLISRGALTLIAKVSDTSSDATYVVNEAALRGYLEKIEALPKPKNAALTIDAANLLALPGVLQPPDDEERLHRARAAFLSMLDGAVKQLIEMRGRGGRLEEELRSHQQVIEEKLTRVRDRAPLESASTSLRLEGGRAAAAAGGLHRRAGGRHPRRGARRRRTSPKRSSSQRHIEQFSELLDAPSDRRWAAPWTPPQEMLREANTIGSSADAEIARDVVEIKGAIDRIKEQVQNVE